MTVTDWETRTPDLVADVWLYPPDQGGKSIAVTRGYGCPVFAVNDTAAGGWSARLQFGEEPFEPGSERRIGFVFLSDEGLRIMRDAGRFYLWDGRFVGEAIVVR